MSYLWNILFLKFLETSSYFVHHLFISAVSFTGFNDSSKLMIFSFAFLILSLCYAIQCKFNAAFHRPSTKVPEDQIWLKILTAQRHHHMQLANAHYQQPAGSFTFPIGSSTLDPHYQLVGPLYISLYCFLPAIHISLFHPITIIFYSTLLSLSNHNNLRLKNPVCTVQLSSKVTFVRVSDATCTCSGRAPIWQKGHGTHVRLAAALL